MPTPVTSRLAPRTSPDESRWWLWGGTAALGLVMAAGNMALQPLFLEGAIRDNKAAMIFCAFWAGVVAAQTGLAAIWLALGRLAAITPMTLVAAAYLVLAGAVLAGAGMRVMQKDESIQFWHISEDLIPLLLIPSLVAAAAAPLWFLRLIFGWHIRHVSAPPAVFSRQYSIGSMLTLTTLAAVLLGSLQWARSLLQHQLDPGYFWLIFGGWAFVALVLSVVTVLPAALGLSRNPVWGFGILGVVVMGCLMLLGFYFLAALNRLGGNVRPDEVLIVVGITCSPLLSYFASLALPHWGVWLCGYRLVMGKGDQPRS